jgi:charged multivesicular body protein 5
MQDEMEDLLEMANEVQETIGRAYGVPDDIDDEELEAELDMLEEELLFEEGEPSYLEEAPVVNNETIKKEPVKVENPIGL